MHILSVTALLESVIVSKWIVDIDLEIWALL